MSAVPTEDSHVEKPLIAQLRGMGWQHVEGDIDVAELTERETFRDVLLRGRLREAVKRINADQALTDVEIDRAIRQLEVGSTQGLLERNCAITELVHLLEGSHGAQFYERLRRACPEYEGREAWLEENGDRYGL